MTRNVIFIDDERSIRHSLSQTLELEDYDVQAFASAKDALTELGSLYDGVIITDINMPGIDGIEFLRRALVIDDEFQVIVLTGHGDISTAVEAMRLGAYDFLEKPFSTDHLLDVVKRAADKRQLILENRELRDELAAQSSPGPRILGNDPSIKQLRRVLTHLKTGSSSIHFHGEPGTGRSLAARFFHDHSSSAASPFVKINCQSVSSHALENDLFAGVASSNNLFSASQGGTLFLADIDKLTAQNQSALLQQLKSHRQKDSLSCRILSSGESDLKLQADKGLFNTELFDFIDFVPIHLPPLRERKEDILTLYNNFTRTVASRYGLVVPHIPPELESQLIAHRWGGNVRELRNVAERHILLGETFNREHATAMTDLPAETTLADRVSQFEYTVLRDALTRHGGRLKEVQEELGLARKTLYDKMRKHCLEKEDFKIQ